jgi:NADH-quinone oxidoreductase subunit J
VERGDDVVMFSNATLPIDIAFTVLAIAMIGSAIRVVTTKNVVHAALYLVVVLAGVAAQYILLASEFVAISQVLVYIGAIIVLFLFGIMLTRAQVGPEEGLNNQGWVLGIPVALLLFGVLAYGVFDAVEDTVIEEPDASTIAGSTVAISDGYLGPYLIPLIALSFVLLAAAVGAIVLARKD